MDYPEGFFPERRILAMRRQALLVHKAPAQPADSRRVVAWILFAVFFPTCVTMGSVIAFRRPAILLAGCYLLAGLALAGIFVGSCRALRRHQLTIP